MSAAASQRPKVSVTIVTYNHESFIGPCLESVVRQETNFPFEVLVGEDASTDGTAAVVREYAERYPAIVRPIFQPRNVGVQRNWQMVLDAARGEYLAHLDGDDLMRPGRLQQQVDHLDAHPDDAMVFANVAVFDSDSGRTSHLFTAPGAARPRTMDELVRSGTVYCHSSKMYRRSSLPAEGLDPRTQHVMDWLLHLQNARHGGIGYIDAVLGEYRKHGAGTTALPLTRAAALLEEQLYTIEQARAFGASDEACAHARGRVLYLLALRHLEAGNDAEFQALLEQSLREGVIVSTPHRVCAAVRRVPSLARVLQRAYTRLSVRPRLARTTAGS